MVALRDTSGIRPTFNNLQNKTLYFSARIIRHTFIINILEYENVVVINILEEILLFHYTGSPFYHKKQLIPCSSSTFHELFFCIFPHFIFFYLFSVASALDSCSLSSSPTVNKDFPL